MVGHAVKVKRFCSIISFKKAAQVCSTIKVNIKEIAGN
jgi:hypothetical protein